MFSERHIGMWMFSSASISYFWLEPGCLFNSKSIILISKMVLKMGWTLSTGPFKFHTQQYGSNGIINTTGDQPPVSHSSEMNGVMECQQIMQQAPPLLIWIPTYSRVSTSYLGISLKMFIRWCIVLKLELVRPGTIAQGGGDVYGSWSQHPEIWPSVGTGWRQDGT